MKKMDDILKITLPSFIGIAISTPIMLMVDLTKQSSQEMLLILMPMMAGAAISMGVGFFTMKKDFKEIKDETK